MSVITIGEILVEMVAEEKGQTFEESGLFYGPYPSGAPAIFIDQASLCGSKAKIISTVGNDGFGKLNISRLSTSGVDTSYIIKDESKTTGTAFVSYKDDGDRDFLFHLADSASGHIKESNVTAEALKDCKYFHIMGSSVYNKGIRNAIDKCINLLPQESKISFDPNIRKEILTDEVKLKYLKSILKVSDIVLGSIDEFSYLINLFNEQEIVKTLFRDFKVEIVVIKKGNKGSTVYYMDKKIEISPYTAIEVDPTGAGDCYAGTFISLINQGYLPEDAAKYASAAGALAVTKRGPMEGNSTIEELKKFMKGKNI